MPSVLAYRFCTATVRLVVSPFTSRRTIGREHVPSEGACILAPNHISHFDPPFIGSASHRVADWMAMRELFELPVVGKLLRWAGTFPVEMGKFDMPAVRAAIERLKAGRMVGVFPEGGLRTGPNSVLEGAPLKPGVSALAQMTGARVLPCVIIGSDALYDPKMWRPFRRVRVWVAFGPTLDPPGDKPDKAAAREEFEKRLGDTLRDLYRRTVREESIPAECLPQTPQRRKGKA
jgi:1-acyl-sn-glycerol-3-phosphate acyltransferase